MLYYCPTSKESWLKYVYTCMYTYIPLLMLLLFFCNVPPMDKLLSILQNPAHRSSLVHFPSLPVNSIYLLLCLPHQNALCKPLSYPYLMLLRLLSSCLSVPASSSLWLPQDPAQELRLLLNRCAINICCVPHDSEYGEKRTCEAVSYTLSISDRTKHSGRHRNNRLQKYLEKH